MHAPYIGGSTQSRQWYFYQLWVQCPYHLVDGGCEQEWRNRLLLLNYLGRLEWNWEFTEYHYATIGIMLAAFRNPLWRTSHFYRCYFGFCFFRTCFGGVRSHKLFSSKRIVTFQVSIPGCCRLSLHWNIILSVFSTTYNLFVFKATPTTWIRYYIRVLRTIEEAERYTLLK